MAAGRRQPLSLPQWRWAQLQPDQTDGSQGWSLTQLLSVSFLHSRIILKKVRFSHNYNQGLHQLLMKESWYFKALIGRPDGVFVSQYVSISESKRTRQSSAQRAFFRVPYLQVGVAGRA